MKKIIFLLVTAVMVLSFWGCSKSTNLTEPEVFGSINGQNYQRPEFIDTRPDEVIQQHVKSAPEEYQILRKKPTNPGGGNNGNDEPQEDPNPNPANKYAYIIGISNYEGTANDLQYCDDDAIDWKNYLEGEGFVVNMDLDLQANANNIESGLQWLVNNAVAGDEIAFIYSGHGTKYSTSGSCIISSDLYYLSHDYVMSYLSTANCSKKMIAIDACLVGDFHDNVENNMIMATASDNSYSYDGESWMQNGVWTYYYLESLVNNGTIFNEDAIEYAKIQMKLWGRAAHVRVTPKNSDLYTGVFDI